jgi:hypothetical protein
MTLLSLEKNYELLLTLCLFYSVLCQSGKRDVKYENFDDDDDDCSVGIATRLRDGQS